VSRYTEPSISSPQIPAATRSSIKTASRKPGSISPAHIRQIATYTALRGERCARIDTLIRTKTPSIVQHTHVTTPVDEAHVEAIYPIVADAIAIELYYTTRARPATLQPAVLRALANVRARVGRRGARVSAVVGE
jgi:hypothetical protein